MDERKQQIKVCLCADIWKGLQKQQSRATAASGFFFFPSHHHANAVSIKSPASHTLAQMQQIIPTPFMLGFTKLWYARTNCVHLKKKNISTVLQVTKRKNLLFFVFLFQQYMTEKHFVQRNDVLSPLIIMIISDNTCSPILSDFRYQHNFVISIEIAFSFDDDNTIT